jgi:ferredoxin
LIFLGLVFVILGGLAFYLYYGPASLVTYAMFVTVPVAIALIVDTKIKGKFSEERGGWWTGVVVDGKQVSIRVDWNSCMGAASCVELAPKVFRLDWEKKKSVFDPAPLEILDQKGDVPEKIFVAAQSCPFRAIVLEDEATGERIFP